MMRSVEEAPLEKQLALVRAHPELAGGEALTLDSNSEQARLGFNRLSKAELERVNGLNRRYRDKFGFPCIVALRLHANRTSVMDEMERRLGNNAETELARALEQIGHITRGRLDKLLAEG
jgi:OHCU decarboxylase